MFYFLFLTNLLKQRLLWGIEIFTGQGTNHRHWLTGENYEMTGNYRSPAVICSIVYMNRLRHQNHKNEIKKRNPWYNWLINYIPELIKNEMVGSVKDKIMSLFKINSTKIYRKPVHVKNVMEVERNRENQQRKKQLDSKQGN